MMPYFIDAITDAYNRNLLLKRINERDAFDIELNPKSGDLLQISFAGESNYQDLTYGYKYTGEKWETEIYDPLKWMWHHEINLKGKIRNAKVTTKLEIK